MKQETTAVRKLCNITELWKMTGRMNSFFQHKSGSQRSVDRFASKEFFLPSRLEVGWVWGVKTSRRWERCPTHPPLKWKSGIKKHDSTHPRKHVISTKEKQVWFHYRNNKNQFSFQTLFYLSLETHRLFTPSRKTRNKRRETDRAR